MGLVITTDHCVASRGKIPKPSRDLGAFWPVNAVMQGFPFLAAAALSINVQKDLPRAHPRPVARRILSSKISPSLISLSIPKIELVQNGDGPWSGRGSGCEVGYAHWLQPYLMCQDVLSQYCKIQVLSFSSCYSSPLLNKKRREHMKSGLPPPRRLLWSGVCWKIEFRGTWNPFPLVLSNHIFCANKCQIRRPIWKLNNP